MDYRHSHISTLKDNITLSEILPGNDYIRPVHLGDRITFNHRNWNIINLDGIVCIPTTSCTIYVRKPNSYSRTIAPVLVLFVNRGIIYSFLANKADIDFLSADNLRRIDLGSERWCSSELVTSEDFKKFWSCYMRRTCGIRHIILFWHP